jgi:uncharacterized membrane protein YqhA
MKESGFIFIAYHAAAINSAYMSYFPSIFVSEGVASSNITITFLIQAIDAFLIGLVLMIFSGGIYNLFIHQLDSSTTELNSWIKIRSIEQLKRILAQLVILVLFVKFLEVALQNTPSSYRWEMLILPLGIVILALKFMSLNKPDR